MAPDALINARTDDAQGADYAERVAVPHTEAGTETATKSSDANRLNGSHSPDAAMTALWKTMMDKNVGALGRHDLAAEKQNLSMGEMESLFAAHMGVNPQELSNWSWVDGRHEPNTRLFPLHLNRNNGQGIWVKLTNWAVDAQGRVDAGSERRGRLTEDFRIAPFFEDVLAKDIDQRTEAA